MCPCSRSSSAPDSVIIRSGSSASVDVRPLSSSMRPIVGSYGSSSNVGPCSSAACAEATSFEPTFSACAGFSSSGSANSAASSAAVAGATDCSDVVRSGGSSACSSSALSGASAAMSIIAGALGASGIDAAAGCGTTGDAAGGVGEWRSKPPTYSGSAADTDCCSRSGAGAGASTFEGAGAFSAAGLSGITPIVKRGRVGCIACAESGVTSLSGWMSLQLTGDTSTGVGERGAPTVPAGTAAVCVGTSSAASCAAMSSFCGSTSRSL